MKSRRAIDHRVGDKWGYSQQRKCCRKSPCPKRTASQAAKKLLFCEGYGFQPVHKPTKPFGLLPLRNAFSVPSGDNAALRAEKVSALDGADPQRLKPRSFRSSYVRPKGRTLQVQTFPPQTQPCRGLDQSPSCQGASINSILPSRLRCRTFTLPSLSRNTKTSRSRNSASLTASSSVIGRSATESSERTT